MDLLDSIMSKMDKPPSISDKQKKMMKEQQKVAEEARMKERERLNVFRKTIEERIGRFLQNPELMKKRFEPMDRVTRSIARDVADVAGLTTYAFGIEDQDRHVMVFKKEYQLSEEELNCYKSGVEWDPEQAKETAKIKAQQKEDEEQRLKELKNEPTSAKFLEKIEGLVGKETGKDSARILKVNDQFGFVKSELKKDKRTIEETLADIRAKKQKKSTDDEHQDETETPTSS